MEYNDALVLFSEKKISSIQSIIPALELANTVSAFTVSTDDPIKYLFNIKMMSLLSKAYLITLSFLGEETFDYCCRRH